MSVCAFKQDPSSPGFNILFYFSLWYLALIPPILPFILLMVFITVIPGLGVVEAELLLYLSVSKSQSKNYYIAAYQSLNVLAAFFLTFFPLFAPGDPASKPVILTFF